MMEYEKFIQAAQSLPFIQDQTTADAAVKAVLGILASKLHEPEARDFTADLPEPLSYDRLHSHQARRLPISVAEFVEVISHQFQLDPEQSRQLIITTLEVTKSALEEETIQEVVRDLPAGWSQLITDLKCPG